MPVLIALWAACCTFLAKGILAGWADGNAKEPGPWGSDCVAEKAGGQAAAEAAAAGCIDCMFLLPPRPSDTALGMMFSPEHTSQKTCAKSC